MIPHEIPIPFEIIRVQIPNANFYKGRDRWAPDMIVIHATEAGRASTIATFQDGTGKSNPGGNVSAHFLVCKNGDILQFVGTADTAYANGVVVNPTDPTVIARLSVPDHNPNLYTISLETELLTGETLTDAQYESHARLVKFLHDKWDIPIDRKHIIGHREIDANKTCPDLVNIDKIISDALCITN